MKEVKALAVITRPELEKALEQMNVTRHDMHKLIELQQEQVRVLREALVNLMHKQTAAAFSDAQDALAATEPRP